MASEAQIKANRRNAKKSSGPKSTEGKLTVSKNAITYGIFSNLPLLPHENADEFNALCENISSVFPAVDAYAAGLVERIVICIWRQQRLRLAEAAKLRISLLPEVMVADINASLRSPNHRTLTANDISDTQETRFQYFSKALSEIKSILISSVSPTNLPHLKERAPNTYEQLELLAKKNGHDWPAFSQDEKLIKSGLTSLKEDWVGWVERNQPKHVGFKIAEQLQTAKLVPMGSNLEFLVKYQTQLDTDLYRAIDAYKRHVEWREKHLEVEVNGKSVE